MADSILADVDASGIYRIRNVNSGKCYVGSAKRFKQRWATHRSELRRGLHANKHLMRAWLKYGEESFVFEILEKCEPIALIPTEQSWMDKLRPEYNLAPRAGNCLGVKHSEEAKRKISERNKGNKYCLGRRATEKCKAAVAMANRGRRFKRPPAAILATAEKHRGMKRSEETRRKISESRRGKKLKQPRSAEYRAKISAAHKGRKISDEHMAALQAGRSRRVFTEEQRLATAKDVRDSYRDGRRSSVKSREHLDKIGKTCAKLSDEQVRDIRARHCVGETVESLARLFGSPPSTITQICKGTRYRWVL
jgi:hypothetical protein